MLEIKDCSFTSRDDVLNFLNTNFHKYTKKNNLRFCHTEKSDFFDITVDGYLGTVPYDLLQKMETVLKKENWYGI